MWSIHTRRLHVVVLEVFKLDSFLEDGRRDGNLQYADIRPTHAISVIIVCCRLEKAHNDDRKVATESTNSALCKIDRDPTGSTGSRFSEELVSGIDPSSGNFKSEDVAGRELYTSFALYLSKKLLQVEETHMNDLIIPDCSRIRSSLVMGYRPSWKSKLLTATS
jgi:hypothetical protein